MYPTLDLRKFFLYTSHIFKIINNMWANTIMSPEITKKNEKNCIMQKGGTTSLDCDGIQGCDCSSKCDAECDNDGSNGNP